MFTRWKKLRCLVSAPHFFLIFPQFIKVGSFEEVDTIKASFVIFALNKKLYLLPFLKFNPKFTYFFSERYVISLPSIPTMSPRAPTAELRASPLTNGKLLATFKGIRPNIIKIEDVSALGDMYMQKATSIRFLFQLIFESFNSSVFRRFASSFSNLRLERVQLKRSRNVESLAAFEQDEFVWPAKEQELPAPSLQNPVEDAVLEFEVAADGDSEPLEGPRPGVTLMGRVTGENCFILSV